MPEIARPATWETPAITAGPLRAGLHLACHGRDRDLAVEEHDTLRLPAGRAWRKGGGACTANALAVTEDTLAIEPSAGYANPPPIATVSLGALGRGRGSACSAAQDADCERVRGGSHSRQPRADAPVAPDASRRPLRRRAA